MTVVVHVRRHRMLELSAEPLQGVVLEEVVIRNLKATKLFLVAF